MEGDKFAAAFKHLAFSEDSDSLEYLKSVKNLFALLTLLEIRANSGIPDVARIVKRALPPQPVTANSDKSWWASSSVSARATRVSRRFSQHPHSDATVVLVASYMTKLR